MNKDLRLSIEEIDAELRGSVLGTFIEYRYRENRDVKIIITSKGSTTGLGKTTLAMILCYFADIYGWNADNKGHINIGRYISKYKSCDNFSALLIDEIEHGADSRRAMSQDNVDLSHAWAQLRYRNITSVATLPSTSMVDNRMMELADIWINVVAKGKAIPFYIWTNDFTGQVHRQRLTHPANGNTEILFFPKINNEDFKIMEKKKDQSVRVGEDHNTYDEEDIKEIKEQTAREVRNDLIKKIYHHPEIRISQAKLSAPLDVTQSRVSQIVKD